MRSNNSRLFLDRRDIRLDRDDEDEDLVFVVADDSGALDGGEPEGDDCEEGPAPEDLDADATTATSHLGSSSPISAFSDNEAAIGICVCVVSGVGLAALCKASMASSRAMAALAWLREDEGGVCGTVSKTNCGDIMPADLEEADFGDFTFGAPALEARATRWGGRVSCAEPEELELVGDGEAPRLELEVLKGRPIIGDCMADSVFGIEVGDVGSKGLGDITEDVVGRLPSSSVVLGVVG